MKKINFSFAMVLFVFSYQTSFAVEFSLFGDISLRDSNRDESNHSFSIGELDLITNQDVDEKTTLVAEIVFEDQGHGFDVDIERFRLRRTVSELFQISAGKIHTPIGFWVWTFHHGLLLQDTVTRPFFLDFEDTHEGIFPTHAVGVFVSGERATEALKVDYTLGIASTSSINTTSDEHVDTYELTSNNFQDPATDKSFTSRVGFSSADHRLGLGLSYMLSVISESAEADATALPENQPLLDRGGILFEQKIGVVDFRYRTDWFYLLAEYYHMTVDDNSGINTARYTPNPKSYTADAYYTQLGVYMGPKFTLSLRHESLQYDDNAGYFELLGISETTRNVAALRYNFSENNALILESAKNDVEGGDSFTQYELQWLFLIL